MNTQTTHKLAPVQNLGITDRIFRFFIGGAMLGIGAFLEVTVGVNIYDVGLMLLSIYPLMTTLMGWDPVYEMLGAKTCSIEGGHNACGTFPYELDAALGNEPEANKSYDHSLSGSVHNIHKDKVA